MLKKIQLSLISILFITFTFADILITEISDQTTNTRFIEFYNNGASSVDLSDYQAHLFSNGSSSSGGRINLPDFLDSGEFWVVCKNLSDFEAAYGGGICDSVDGQVNSNGDDVFALFSSVYDSSDLSNLVDLFGEIGVDGTGECWQHNDASASRLSTSASSTFLCSDWDFTAINIDDPSLANPGEWDGAGGGSDTCEDGSACNTGADGACEYPDAGYDCAGDCVAEVDCAGTCGGDAVVDCAGTCGGSAVVDGCGECGGDNSTCSVSVTFTVDMNLEGVTGDIKLRTSTVNGEYNPSDWYVMGDNGDGTYSYSLSLVSGIEYGYNFNNSDGSGYESGDELGDCAGGNYGNDRYVTPGDSDMALDTVCWELCEACPSVIPGCTDEAALNYDENATEDDGSCFWDWPEAANLFLSEYAEGSSNNKYLEIYNGSDSDVDLSGYSLSRCSNGCDPNGIWEYLDAVIFEVGTILAASEVYVVCHGSSDDSILAECDQLYSSVSNGDDVFGLTQIGSGIILDIIGDLGDDPGPGWAVGDDSNGTQDQTLVRKSSVQSGNGGDWATSAGTNADDSEWVVLDQNTWDYLGSHPHEFASCDDVDADGICDDVDDCVGVYDECGACNGEGISEGACDCDGNVEDECGECGGDGSSCACTPGDVNGDSIINVQDIIVTISYILESDVSNFDADCADLNSDGTINVQDIVQMVTVIIGSRTADATEASLIKVGNALNLDADGYIGAVQMTLSHGADFSIELTDKAMVADYRTNGNETTLIIVVPESDELLIANGEYEIVDLIVVNSADIMDVNIMPSSFVLSAAYPNPFNPSTTINLHIEHEGLVKVNVFNLAGKEVAQLSNKFVEAGVHSMTWVAEGYPSGVYLIRADMMGATSVQKVILLK